MNRALLATEEVTTQIAITRAWGFGVLVEVLKPSGMLSGEELRGGVYAKWRHT